MRSMRLGILLWCGTLLAPGASGMFVLQQTQAVPLARVLSNLQQRLARDTNDIEATYYLARVYSMAYSTNLTQVETRPDSGLPVFNNPYDDAGVPQSIQPFATPAARESALKHLTNAIVHYERSIYLLKRSDDGKKKTWLILPCQLGLAWCLDQAGRTNDAIAAYRKALKIAWKREVTGDFEFKEWVNDAWTDIRTRQNPLRTHNRGYVGPGACYSEEIINYLLRLLDPVNDASEIAQLKKDEKTLATTGRVVTPIFIPLTSGSFHEFVNVNARVAFDLDGSGLQRRWGWLTPKAGWLVFDPLGTGRITSALQMFGNVTFWIFWPDGYEALSSLDDNGDGILTGQELRGLAVWTDVDGDGVSEPGEVIPVEALGIQSLSCRSQADETGMRWNPCGVGFTNGVFRATYDWTVSSRNDISEN